MPPPQKETARTKKRGKAAPQPRQMVPTGLQQNKGEEKGRPVSEANQVAIGGSQGAEKANKVAGEKGREACSL